MTLPRSLLADRRTHDRHPFRTGVDVVLLDGRIVTGRTIDLGTGGAGVVVDLNLVVGSRVTVRMSLPARPIGKVAFEARATIANCTLTGGQGGFRLGVKFESLSSEALGAIKGALPA